ncbi:MAG TPA: LegC family aminotransferase [Clostridiaceae bacterium]|nr:LegC family aminotransferase [Clostridiaceae bacterium]
MSSKRIPLSIPNLHIEIADNIREAIETGWITEGKFLTDFERKFADYTKAKYAKAVQSGTAGLHLSLLTLGVEPDDEVIVPTLTFIAAVNPVSYCRAHPVFMDCDDSLNMDPKKLRRFLKEECVRRGENLINKKTNRVVRGIVIVHVFGNPIDMFTIKEIADEFGLFILEDATEALGSWYTEGVNKNKHCGTIGDIGVFSFNANKIATTGGGGMVISNNQEHTDQVAFLSTQAKSDPWRFRHDEIGYNYRMTNIAAAVGISQLNHIEEFVETKTRNYQLYKKELAKDNLQLIDFNNGTRPNYWFYSLIVDKNEFGLSNEELMLALNDIGIQTRPIWGLIHKQKPYLKAEAYQIEKAQIYADLVLNLPCSTNLSSEDVMHVVNAIRNFASK